MEEFEEAVDIEETERVSILRRLMPVLVVLLILALSAYIVTQYFYQQRKLEEIAMEKQQLQQKIEELTREQERLESNLEYVKSPEGLLQYAREMGYSLPDDIRIDVSD